jgi:hypothetical protein
MLKENEVLKKEIKKLDSKLNTAFRYLLDKLDALSEKKKTTCPLGFEIPKKNK